MTSNKNMTANAVNTATAANTAATANTATNMDFASMSDAELSKLRRIVIPCIGSFMHVFEPNAINGSEPKYSMSCLFPETDAATRAKVDMAIAAATELGKRKKWGGKIPANMKSPLHLGSIDRPDDPAYAGMIYFNANSKDAPQIVDRRKQTIADPLAVYSGAYYNVSLSVYPFSTSGNKGVAVGLGNIQFVKDGDRLGGRSTAASDFDVLDNDDTEGVFGSESEVPDWME